MIEFWLFLIFNLEIVEHTLRHGESDSEQDPSDFQPYLGTIPNTF